MPIKGLTERKLAFPEIGQIRKGAKKTDHAPGRDLTYFRIEFDEKEADAAAKFAAIYPKEPTEINVVLPFNEIERCWDAWLEAYSAGRMVARSDGERYLYKVNTGTGEREVLNGEPPTPYHDGDVVGTWKNRKTGKDENITCKPVGRLKVILPELQRLAFLTVMTTSKHDIANIDDQLRALKEINGGRIAGIPLVLRRRPKKISTPGKDDSGQAKRFTKWMLSIEADPEWVKAKLLEVKHLALPGNGLALPEPISTTPEGPKDATEGTFTEAPDLDEEEDGNIPSDPFEDQPEPAPEPELDSLVENAKLVETQNGTPLGKLTLEQLTVYIDKMSETQEEKRSTKFNDRLKAALILQGTLLQKETEEA